MGKNPPPFLGEAPTFRADPAVRGAKKGFSLKNRGENPSRPTFGESSALSNEAKA
jgi:hypothetical protein